MASVLQLIDRKQPIISNLLQIKEMLLVKSIMESACGMVMVLQLICTKRRII
jgi:hypothetical protein